MIVDCSCSSRVHEVVDVQTAAARWWTKISTRFFNNKIINAFSVDGLYSYLFTNYASLYLAPNTASTSHMINITLLSLHHSFFYTYGLQSSFTLRGNYFTPKAAQEKWSQVNSSSGATRQCLKSNEYVYISTTWLRSLLKPWHIYGT